MITRTRAAAILVILSAFVNIGWTAPNCERLSSLKLPDTQITSAVSVPAGSPIAVPGGRGNNQITDLPAFCRVAATLKPSSDSDIKVEVWLPETNWNGKFEAVGNGGWAGSI